MPTDNTTEQVLYQWRTARGAVACEFLTEDEARKWQKRFEVTSGVKKFRTTLKLFKVTTTVVTKAL